MIKEAVILAAGQGTRIRGVSGERPKPLVPVGNRTLLDIGVENLLAHGVERIVVVVGYAQEQVRAHVAAMPWRDAVVFVQNDLWEKENGLSVFAARQALQEEWFFVQMVDHIFDNRIHTIADGFARQPGCSYLCIDRDIPAVHDLPDATKLRLSSDGSIAAIAKNLDDFDACDTGLFLMSRSIFPYFEKAIAAGRNTISHAVGDAGLAGVFRTIDVTGVAWLDVDTVEAHTEALRRIAVSC
jgi:choline kinase